MWETSRDVGEALLICVVLAIVALAAVEYFDIWFIKIYNKG